MRLRLLTLVSLALLLGLFVLAQQSQQPPTPPPQTPPPQTPPPTQPPPSQPKPSDRGTGDIVKPNVVEPGRPVYLTGCVQMDDGSPPPREVRVRLACPGISSSGDLRLDPQGCFRVQIGSMRPGGMITTDRDMSGCEIRAELAGYRVGGAMRSGHQSPFGDVDMGTLVLTPLEGGSTISLNSLSAPEDARKAYIKADKELKKKRPDDSKAFRELQKAVTSYPQYASAWQLIGEIHDRGKNEVEARQAFEMAIKADANYVTPYLSLGNIELRNQRWSDLSRLSGTIIQLDPDSVEGQYFQAVSHYRLQDFEVAEKSARYVIDKKQAEKYPSVHLILGDILSQRGEIVPAAAQFRSFLSLRSEGQNSQMVRSRLQAWEQQGVLPKQ